MFKIISPHIRNIKRDHKGATAVEFAFFVIPLMMFIMGIFEIALLSAAGTILQGAMDDAGRLIRTGQVQNAGGNARAAFEEMLCDKVDMYLKCDGLRYEVIPLPEGFSSAAAATAQFDNDGNLDTQGFNPGEENDIVLIRVAYRYPLITPLVGPFFADDGRGNTRLLMSTTVIKNEPYHF